MGVSEEDFIYDIHVSEIGRLRDLLRNHKMTISDLLRTLEETQPTP